MRSKNNSKLTLNKFYILNREYEELKRKIDNLYRELIVENNNLDLDEVNERCNYKETKEIYEMIKYRVEDATITNRLKDMMEAKKEKEYPQTKSVQYYPEIMDIDSLSDNFKIKLDKILREVYSNHLKRRELHYLDKNTLNALTDKKILEKEYILGCRCGSAGCSTKILSQPTLDKYKDYWKKSTENEDSTTDEEDEELNYGCIKISCWNDNDSVIDSPEAFESYPYKKIEYKLIKAPNLKLENI